MIQYSKINFLDRYWACLVHMRWTGLILHDWERIPHNVVSDIDYVVSGPTPSELIECLAAYCNEAGWQIVQILEHEVDSLCCICFQTEAPFESVSLDVTWDYRRKGIDLITNEVLIEGAWQPEGKAFSVPAPHVEFLYRLVKAAAKSKVIGESEELLNSLWTIHQNSSEKVNALLKQHAGVVIERQAGVDEFETQVNEVLDTPYFESVRTGREFSLLEISRFLRRVRQPTGLIVGYQGALGPGVHEEVLSILREAFRSFETKESPGSRRNDWVSRRKSRLILRKSGAGGKVDLEVVGRSALEIVNEILQHLKKRLDKRWSISG